VKKIAIAQRAAVSATRTAQQILRAASIGRGRRLMWKGSVLTSERLRQEIDVTLLRLNCVARDTIVAGGAQAADPHDRGSGTLFAGQSIVVDIFPQHKATNYWGDITRTFCKGEPSPTLARMFKAVHTAQRQALAMIKPGVAASDVHRMIVDCFDRQGFPTSVKNGVVRGFFHGTGHGVGLEIHEAPSIGLTPTKLQAGHVVTVEPGLYDPDFGGVRIEDTVVVTRSGAQILAGFPKKFEV
jgi:Xaa-Pro aminopeptidase